MLMYSISTFAQNSCNCNLSSEELSCLPGDFNVTEAVCIGENENSINTCSDLISKQCILNQSDSKLTPQYLVIKGKFIIDVSYSFTNGSEILMAPQSNIELLENSKSDLQILNSTLFGCSEMWGGIGVHAATSILIKNSIIKDAIVGVVLGAYSNSSFVDNQFINNYISISTPNLQTDLTNIGSYPSDFLDQYNSPLYQTLGGVKGNTFKKEGTLLSPFQNDEPLAGIFMEKVSAFMIGSSGSTSQLNSFENLSNGIVGTFVNYDISNSKFKNIGDQTNTIYGINNSGIILFGLPTQTGGFISTLNFTGLGKDNNISTFENCGTGILTDLSSGNIQNSKFKNVGIATYLGGLGINKYVHDNYIDHFEDRGIVIDIFSTQHCEASNNRIVKNNDVTNEQFSAISMLINDDVENPAPTNLPIKIKNNVIVNNNSIRNNSGIIANQGSNFEITGNTIINHATNFSFQGLGISSVIASKIEDNMVTSDNKLNISSNDGGIIFLFSHHNEIKCNTTDGMAEGIKFSLNNDGSDIQQNTMINHTNYLKFDKPNTITGNQINKINQWPDNNNGNSTIKEAYWPNGQYPSSSIFYTKNTTAELPNPLAGPFDWFQLYTGPENNGWACFETNDEPSGDSNGGRLYHGITAANEGLLDSTLSSSYYNDAYRWEVGFQLFDKLDRYSDLMTSNNVAQNYYNSHSTSALGRLVRAFNQTNAITHIDEATGDTLMVNSLIQDRLNTEIKSLQDQMENLTDTAVINAYFTTLDSKFDSLDMMIQATNHCLSNWKSWASNQASTLLANLSNITPTNFSESNLKQVIQIVLASQVTGNYPQFTQAQKDTLEQVASSCAYAGGRGVYWARALLHKLPSDFNDDNICIPQPIVASTTSISSSGFTVFPNPISDNISLPNDLEGFNKYQIIDLTGTIISSGNINDNKIYINSLTAGMYILKITDTYGKQKIAKFIR